MQHQHQDFRDLGDELWAAQEQQEPSSLSALQEKVGKGEKKPKENPVIPWIFVLNPQPFPFSSPKTLSGFFPTAQDCSQLPEPAGQKVGMAKDGPSLLALLPIRLEFQHFPARSKVRGGLD